MTECRWRDALRALLGALIVALPAIGEAQFAAGPRISLLSDARVGSIAAPLEQASAQDEDLSLRAMMLEEDLCALQKPMRRYTYTWIGALSAVLAAQIGYGLTTLDAQNESERATRAGLLVSTGMTIGGITALSAMRKPELRSCDELRAMKADARVSLRERVAFGEARLARSALAARRQTAWWLHGLAVGLGTAVGLGLGLGFSDNALRATVQGVGTFALTEARILTRPTRARRFLREYRALRFAASPALLRTHDALARQDSLALARPKCVSMPQRPGRGSLISKRNQVTFTPD